MTTLRILERPFLGEIQPADSIDKAAFVVTPEKAIDIFQPLYRESTAYVNGAVRIGQTDFLTNPVQEDHRTKALTSILSSLALQSAFDSTPVTREAAGIAASKKLDINYSAFIEAPTEECYYSGLDEVKRIDMKRLDPRAFHVNSALADTYEWFQKTAYGISTEDQSWLQLLCSGHFIRENNPLHPHNRPELSLFARQKTIK